LFALLGDMMTKLTVKKISKEDVFGDTARVSEEYRKTPSGKDIKSGTVCKIKVNGRSAYAVIRGTPDEITQNIYMDDYLRKDLGVEPGEAHDFKFHPTSVFGSIAWTWKATDPVYRVASRLSVLSLALGILGLILGALPFASEIQGLIETLMSLVRASST
jgi:hypothetical protein